MLGQVILEGVPNPAGAVVSGPLVMGYTVLHFAVFIAFGVFGAYLAARAGDEPLLLLGFILLFCCFEGFFLGFAALLSYALLRQLGWYSIVAGNLVAAVAMLVFLPAPPNLASAPDIPPAVVPSVSHHIDLFVGGFRGSRQVRS